MDYDEITHDVVRPKYNLDGSRQYADIIIVMDNNMGQYNRKIYSLLDVGGDFGGLRDVLFSIIGLMFSPFCEFSFMVKSIQKLFNVKTAKKSQFRRTKSKKYIKKLKKLDQNLTKTEDREKMKQIYLGKVSSAQWMSLWFRDYFGCLPENVLTTNDMVTRWYMIGR